MKQSANLIIDFIVFAFALALSLDKKPNFYKHWKSMLVALIGTTLIIGFIEVYFVDRNILTFEKQWVGTGDYFGLPTVEWLSVFAFTFATIIIFQWLKVYTGRYYKNGGNYLFIGLGLFLVVTGNLNLSHIYAAVFFISSGLLLLLHVILLRSKYTGTFMLTFLLILVVFIVDRVVLARLPVSQLQETSTTSLRFYGMPLEDMVFILLLSLIDITLYESSKRFLEGSKSSGRKRSSSGRD